MFALQLLKVPVTDLAAAKPFWTALLGHPPVLEAAEYGWVQYHVDGIDLALYLHGKGGGDGQPGGSVDFHLSHENLDEVLARLPQEANAAIHGNADGSQSLEATDPDGNLVKVMWRMPER